MTQWIQFWDTSLSQLWHFSIYLHCLWASMWNDAKVLKCEWSYRRNKEKTRISVLIWACRGSQRDSLAPSKMFPTVYEQIFFTFTRVQIRQTVGTQSTPLSPLADHHKLVGGLGRSNIIMKCTNKNTKQTKNTSRHWWQIQLDCRKNISARFLNESRKPLCHLGVSLWAVRPLSLRDGTCG